jgi:hypothetical protein
MKLALPTLTSLSARSRSVITLRPAGQYRQWLEIWWGEDPAVDPPTAALVRKRIHARQRAQVTASHKPNPPYPGMNP